MSEKKGGHLFRANPTFYSFFPTTNCALRARWVTSPWGQKNMSSSQKNSPSGHFWKWTIGSPWLKSWPPPHLLLLSGITSSSSSSFPFPSSSHLSFTYLSYLVTSLSYLLSLSLSFSLSLSLSTQRNELIRSRVDNEVKRKKIKIPYLSL